MSTLQTKMILLAGLGALALLPVAQADERDQKTVITFSAPVEIPGQVLPAGTYVFKLADSSSNRHIVQVFNQDQNRIFGTFLAIPDYRLHPSNKTIIKFEERTAGSPEAIKGWFYPGKLYGHEFVYPKKEAVALAKANNTPVPAMETELKPNMTEPEVAALDTTPLKAEEPTGEEVEIAAAFEVEAPQPPASHSELPARLPNTATSLPLVGLIGLVGLGTGLTLRLAASKTK
jgi:hypothetical protein